ncbi:MAG: helix-turn-helix domain-containing protein [Promethearchaeota archaeon]
MESISKQLKEIMEEKRVFRSSNLFRCILGLNELETNVFSYLLKNKMATTIELSRIFKKDRSSIQRALQNLIELNIVKRDSMSLKEYVQSRGSQKRHNKRGYLYVYKARDLNEIKKEFLDLLNKWYKTMVNYINSFETLFNCFETDGEIC